MVYIHRGTLQTNCVIDVSPGICSGLVSATRRPFDINNSFSIRSAPNKVKYFENTNWRHFRWNILHRAYIGWSNNQMLPRAENSRCLYIQYIFFLRWYCMSGVCAISFNNDKWNYSRVQGLAHVSSCLVQARGVFSKIFSW